MSSQDPATDTSPIRFRPSKKRKLYRQRASSPDPSAQTPEPPRPTTANHRATAADFFDSSEPQEDESEPAVVRATTKSSRRGVGFRSNLRPIENEERGLVVREEDEGKPVEDRFVKHIGKGTVIDDQHMNAFIESRLSNRDSAPSKSEVTSAAVDESLHVGESKTNTKTHGNQIQEVDLPQQLRYNEDDSRKVERPKKVRLGPDGKPWRGGRRKRRGSDDVARDRFVEELLHENRLDVYDHPAKAEEADADGDADERIATQFQKQYLEDVARKQQKNKAAQKQQQEPGEVLKGPKLGGSRNDRAAVREALLKTQKGQK